MSYDIEPDVIYTNPAVHLLAATVSLGPAGNSRYESYPHANFASPDYEAVTSRLQVGGPDLAQRHNDFVSILLEGHGTTLAAPANTSGSPIESIYEQFFNRSEIKMREDLFRYVSPVVIILGNITNIITLFVLRRKKLRRTSVCFYMCAYALANLYGLNLMLGVFWMCDMFKLEYVTYIADWTCRFWTFVNNVFTYCGLWFVVAMNIDRLIFITSRSNAQSHCTVFSAKASVTAIMVGLIVVSIHAMWTYELQKQGCFVAFEPYDLHKIIWPWLSATVYSYLPLSLLIILNLAQGVAICVKHVREVPISQPVEGCQDTFVVTVMVVSLSAFFFNMPATVANVLDIHVPSSWISMEFVAKMELIKNITLLLSSLNYILLGFELFICSREFRHEFLALARVVFCCFTSKRTFKVFEMSPTINSEDSSSPHRHVDYELCNNNEETVTSV